MGISNLLKDPDAFYEDMAAFANSKERMEEGFSHLSYSNGLLTAVIVSPAFVSPKEWLPLLVDMSGEQGSIEDAQLLTNLIMLEYNKILEQLSAEEKVYEPFFWEDSDGRIVTKDWTEGFMAGMRLRSDVWTPILTNGGSILGPSLYALWQEGGFDEKISEAGFDPEEVFTSARNEIPGLICSLYECSADRTFSQPHALQRRVHKIGRNDPCPCGSGKKYKKCCLN